MNGTIIPVCFNCNTNKYLYLYYKKNKFKVLFCRNCKNGFTYPIPNNLSNYYHDNYWITTGVLGKIKNSLYTLFQSRRRRWIRIFMPSGNILDVGSGEGSFSKSLPKSFSTTNLEAPFSKVVNKSVIKADFLNWKTNKKFDAIVFWESLEHVPNPKKYLIKASKLLKKNGLLFIECPNFGSTEAKLFGKNWFHVDIPRHLAHFTKTGLSQLLEKQDFQIIKFQKILAPEYSIWGFVASLLMVFSIDVTDSVKKGRLSIFLLVLPLIMIALFVESIFYFFNDMPVMIMTARKN